MNGCVWAMPHNAQKLALNARREGERRRLEDAANGAKVKAEGGGGGRSAIRRSRVGRWQKEQLHSSSIRTATDSAGVFPSGHAPTREERSGNERYEGTSGQSNEDTKTAQSATADSHRRVFIPLSLSQRAVEITPSKRANAARDTNASRDRADPTRADPAGFRASPPLSYSKANFGRAGLAPISK